MAQETEKTYEFIFYRSEYDHTHGDLKSFCTNSKQNAITYAVGWLNKKGYKDFNLVNEE